MIAPIHTTERWYAVVAASPDPEMNERLNVGVLIGDRGRQQLHFDVGRLRCLLSEQDVTIFSAVLRSLAKDASKGVPFELLRRMAGPQLVVSAPRALSKTLSGESLERFLDRHLRRDRERAAPLSSVAANRAALNAALDRTIDAAMPNAMGMEIERRARFRELYPAISPTNRVPSLDRAVRGPRHDLLIGAVLLNGGDPSGVRSKGARVGHAFWEFGRLRPEIQATTHRSVRLLGLLIERGPNEETQEVGRYLRHLWTKDADQVTSSGSDSDPPPTLVEAIEWAAAQ